ncbi:MAG: glutamate-1-semialdehyde 2,1-aminomutase [Limisphaerales bacterium]|jgi:glutamate-1-semialdehyde 2,1-aminomutase
MPDNTVAITELNRTQSAELFKKAKTLFPGGVSSPVRAFKSVYGPPLFIEKGEGPWITDVDGNRFLDFCTSWGPLIHGHAHPVVIRAITETVKNGTSFGAPSRQENDLGQLIIENHRYLDKLRFVSSGTEAVMSALRLARGYTGRDLILKFEGCYHGHVDSILVKAGSGLVTLGSSTSAGIPESYIKDTRVLELNDAEALTALMEEVGDQLAAIIIEPIPANNGLLLQTEEYLKTLRALCTKYGSVLIFDEVISGFRVGFEGASGLFNIEPDLITMGKVIGGGMPVGAYGGKAEIMACVSPQGDVYQAGTLSGNPVAMAAGSAQLLLCLAEGFYEDQSKRTAQFCKKIRTTARENNWPLQVVQQGSIFWLAFAKEETAIRKASQIDPESMKHFAVFHKYLLDRNIYLGPSGYEVGFVSSVHTEEILDKAADTIISGLAHTFNS